MLKMGIRNSNLETANCWVTGPRPGPEEPPARGVETQPDKDTPSPGGVRAGPEGGMSQ